MTKIIRTVIVSLLAVTLLGGPALADPKDKQPPGQDQKAEKQEEKQEKQEAKAAEKQAKAEEKAAEKEAKAEEKADKKADKAADVAADDPKAPKKPKKDKKDVIPGNNGTIKVDGEPFDLSNGNEPHVGCTFRINFFNFDEATKTSTVTFAGHAPSGGGTFLVDAVTFSGSDGSSPVYSLSSFDQAALALASPHPQQGYHVKVTTSTPFSNGNDTKSKVFWINCPPPTTTAVAPEAQARDADSIDLAPMQAEPAAEVLGTRITRPQAVAPAEAQGTEIFGLALPFTGRGIAVLVLIGLGLLAAGAMTFRRDRA